MLAIKRKKMRFWCSRQMDSTFFFSNVLHHFLTIFYWLMLTTSHIYWQHDCWGCHGMTFAFCLLVRLARLIGLGHGHQQKMIIKRLRKHDSLKCDVVCPNNALFKYSCWPCLLATLTVFLSNCVCYMLRLLAPHNFLKILLLSCLIY